MPGFSDSIKSVSEVMAKSMQAMSQSINLKQAHVSVMQMVQPQHLNTTQVRNNYVQQQQTTLSSQQSFLKLIKCLHQITHCDYMISCLTL